MSMQKLLLDFLDEVEYLVQKDVAATSEELFTSVPGGKARPATNYMTEVGAFNAYTARYVKDPENTPHIGIGPQPETTQVDSKRKASIMVTKGFKDLRKTIESMTDEELNQTVLAQWNEPITKAHYILHALGHAMYHDGQLNLTHLISGDDTLHWTD